MFEDFLKNCPPEDEIKPSDERIEKNIAALRSLIGQEEKNVTKRKFRLKPLIIAAVIAILSGVSLLSASAAIQANIVNFFMGGEELEGEYSDYVDGKGYRHITFSAVLPMDEENFAVICDVDAPQGENVRVLTGEPFNDLMEKLDMYYEANNEHWREYGDHQCQHDGIAVEDFVDIKDSEFYVYEWTERTDEYVLARTGNFGGKVSRTDSAMKKPVYNGIDQGIYYDYDHENNTKTLTIKYNYYVGKE